MAEHVQVTPNNLRIVFEDGLADEGGRSKRRQYTVNGEKFPSVTTVLGLLEKPGLKHAAERLTVEGCVELAQAGEMDADPAVVTERLQARGLRFWQVWEGKADRGELTHDDLLQLALGAEPRELDGLPDDQLAMARGASGWFADVGPVAAEGQCELMVASPKHRVAGRHDFCGTLAAYPALPDNGIVDYKTTERLPRYKDGRPKPPYLEAVAQVGGYNLARIGSGYEGCLWGAVVRIDATGAHDTFVFDMWPAQKLFLALLRAYQEVSEYRSGRMTRKAVEAFEAGLGAVA